MTWWWVAYTDETRPKGERSLGAIIVQHPGATTEIAADLVLLGLAPSGVPVFGEIASQWGDPPIWLGLERGAGEFLVGAPTRVRAVSRLLNREEALALAKAWDPGHGGLADEEDIRGAFEDDDAAEGSPLFDPGRR